MIREIDPTSAAQLKSGQVIVELANCIKELLENAIDANATAVTVKIHNYGLDGVQVTDNGDGIHPADFEFVARAHSTSKITTFEDLTAVETLGFRGEALASLCQVASLSIQTNTGEKGYKLEFNRDGSLAKQTVAPLPKGTTVTINDFFMGLPVRRKDLERNYKKKYTETIRVLQSYAVIWDGTLVIEHVLKDNKRSTVLRAQGSNISDRISLIFGPKTASNIISIDAKGTHLHLTGRISRPLALIKGQRSSTRLLYINGRPVNDKHISKLVVSVFQEYEPHGSPFFALNLLISPRQLDINVTPDKRDVRLLQGYKVMGEIEKLLREAIENKGERIERGASVRIEQQQQQPIGNMLSQFLGSGPIYNQNGRNPDDSQLDSQESQDSDPAPHKFPRISTSASRPSTAQSLSSAQSSLRLFSYGDEDQQDQEEPLTADMGQKEHCEKDQDDISDEEIDRESHTQTNFDILPSQNEPALDILPSQTESLVPSQTAAALDILPSQTESLAPSQTESVPEPLYTPELDHESTATQGLNHENPSPQEPAIVQEISDELMVPEYPPQSGQPDLPSEPPQPMPGVVSKSLNCHISLPTTIEEIEAAMAQLPKASQPKIRNFAVDNEEAATERLNLTIVKSDFREMRVIGQFNLGFILVLKQHGEKSDIFIIDQHASDEIYNFERLQKTTVMRRQPLVVQRQLELSAVEELTVVNNLHVFERNGFSIRVDPDAPPGKQCFLTALPYSKGTIFNESDINELVYKVSESQGDGNNIRCSKLRSMFAMRACRSSIMVGDSLSPSAMKKVVNNLGTLDKPWNCPHGRPTLRHITTLG